MPKLKSQSMPYAQIKVQAKLDRAETAAMLENARTALVKKLTDTHSFRKLKAELEANEYDDKKNCLFQGGDDNVELHFNVYLDECLYRDENDEFDADLALAVLNEACEYMNYKIEGTSGQVQVTVNHGECVLVNYPNERGVYSLYCNGLGLKVDRLNSEEHGIMLAERAMREHGYFPGVCRSNARTSECFYIDVPKAIRDASDAELAAMIQAAEAVEE